MKIYLLSVHNIGNNFGTTLQACALYDYVVSLGYNTQIINYRPPYSYNKGKIGQTIKKVLFYKAAKIQEKRYDQYYSEHSYLTEEVHSYSQLSRFDDGDLYIIGSDQVWNPYYKCGQDMAYYLQFTSKKKMAYSASVGQLLSEEELNRLLVLTANFKKIGVREECSMVQFREIGRDDVLHVVDPVFLHDKQYYISSDFNKPYDKYILLYAVSYDEELDYIVQKTKELLGLPVVLLGGFKLKYKCDLYYREAGPVEFTNLINCCTYFIANSFHGTAFSILFEKQFFAIKSKVSPERIESLLHKLELDNRFLRSDDDIETLVNNKIDYQKTSRILNGWIEYSKSFLNNSIVEILGDDNA